MGKEHKLGHYTGTTLLGTKLLILGGIVYRGVLTGDWGFHCIQRCPVHVSGDWDIEGIPLYTEVSSFHGTEI